MLIYKPAASEQYDEFMQLMQDEAADYLKRTMELMQMTLEQAKHLFKTVGMVYGICKDDKSAGFYWIEEREKNITSTRFSAAGRFSGNGNWN